MGSRRSLRMIGPSSYRLLDSTTHRQNQCSDGGKSITMCLSFALNVFLKVVCGNMKRLDKFERWSAKEHKNLPTIKVPLELASVDFFPHLHSLKGIKSGEER